MLYIIIAPYILLNLKGRWCRSLGLSVALIVPLLIALPWMWSKLLPALGELQVSLPLPGHVEVPALLAMYGVIPLALCFAGVIYLALRRDRRSCGLILGLALLLITGLVLLWFKYGSYFIYAHGLHTAPSPPSPSQPNKLFAIIYLTNPCLNYIKAVQGI